MQLRVDGHVEHDAEPAVDPVWSTGTGDVCAGPGLFITSPGIALNLGSCTIRGGKGSAIGVNIKVGGTTISGGLILGFSAAAVVVEQAVGGHLSGLQVLDGPGDGIVVAGGSDVSSPMTAIPSGAP